MLDDAQQPQWPAMIQDLVRHYAVLWHESDTSLRGSGRPTPAARSDPTRGTWITSLQQIDVLGISFEKGGTSVLADGYLVAGSLTAEQRESIFGFGVPTQLMNDLEGLPHNLADRFLTIFSQTARQRPLDTVTNRALHLCTRILMQLDGLNAADLGPFKDLITRSVNLLLINLAGRSARLYPRHYIRELETYSPFRFAALRQRRKQLAGQQISLPRLIDLLAAGAGASAGS